MYMVGCKKVNCDYKSMLIFTKSVIMLIITRTLLCYV